MSVRLKLWIAVDVLDDDARSLPKGDAACRTFAGGNTGEMVQKLFPKSPLGDNPEGTGFFVVQLNVTEIGTLQFYGGVKHLVEHGC